MAPGDGETPVVAAGPDWKSTTEPIIAKTLGGKGRPKPHRPDARPDHTHDLEEPEAAQ
jgi:hypothetical protein